MYQWLKGLVYSFFSFIVGLFVGQDRGKTKQRLKEAETSLEAFAKADGLKPNDTDIVNWFDRVRKKK